MTTKTTTRIHDVRPPKRRGYVDPRELRSFIPRYEGEEWVDVEFPRQAEFWPKFSGDALIELSGDDYDDASRATIRRYAAEKPWIWPDERICFLCDIHADTDAFFRSLVATGGVAKTGPNDDEFELTETGRRSRFVIGGDCFDKGPSNLRLLRALRRLIDTGATVEILAGNHDLRALLGFAYAGSHDVKLAHLFARMGRKSVPLFREIFDEYLQEVPESSFLSDEEVRERLFPPESWFEEFPAAVRHLVLEEKIEKEVRRIREKMIELTVQCRDSGMTLGMVHAAFEKARELFLSPDGEFHWYFERTRLAWRAGSFLFIHAGVDDKVARWIRHEGIDGLNQRFWQLMSRDLFELYHGPIGNTFRTKYRPEDLPFTETGVQDMHASGIYAIVHGHRNITRGQRLAIRAGLLNFECDASVDRNTRRICALEGPGGATVIFEPRGAIVAISTDYPYAKVFQSSKLLSLTVTV